MDKDNGVPLRKKAKMTEETMFSDKSSSIVSQAIREGIMVESMSTFICRVCKNSSMTGIIPAASHLQGTKHKKAVQNSKMEAAMEQIIDSPDSPVNSVHAALKRGIVTSKWVGTQLVLTCGLCDKPCSGEVPMLQHLSSEAHAKKLREEAFKSSFSSHKERPAIPNTSTTQYDSVSPRNQPSVVSPADQPSIISPRNQPFIVSPADQPSIEDVDAAISRGQVISKQLGTVVMLTCVPCNKSCSGKVPMMQHLASEIHARKLRLGGNNSSFSPQKEVPIIPSALATQHNFAATADVFSVQGDEFAQAMREGTIMAAEHDASHLQCLVCKTFCTGVDSMKEHLRGKSHIKKQNISQLPSKRSLTSSSLSSPTHSEASQYSPSPCQDGMSHKDKSISVDLSSGLEQPSVVVDVVVKKGSIYECTVCKVTCNSHTQVTSHLQGDPHKKQCRMRQSTQFLQQLVASPEAEPQTPSLPLASSTPDKNTECTIVIPPPLQFKDSPQSSPATQKMKHEENASSYMEESIKSSARRYLGNGYSKKQPSKRLMNLLPDIRVYTSEDRLTDLFEE